MPPDSPAYGDGRDRPLAAQKSAKTHCFLELSGLRRTAPADYVVAVMLSKYAALVFATPTLWRQTSQQLPPKLPPTARPGYFPEPGALR